MAFKPLKVVMGVPPAKDEDIDKLYIKSTFDFVRKHSKINLLQDMISNANKSYKNLDDAGQKLALDADPRLKLELEPDYLDLARISCQCYEHFDRSKKLKKSRIHKDPPIKGFELICCAQKGSYHGCLYFRGATETHHTQLVIAHKGTTANWSGKGDFETNIDGVALNHYSQHHKAACTFAIWILNKLEYEPTDHSSESVPPSPQPPAQIIFTGHSLGGWLAQVSSFSAKYHQITEEGETLSFTRRYNYEYAECEDWFHPRCIVFDSPGAYWMIEKLWHRPEFRDCMPGSEDPRLDIKNLVRCPNQVNCINWHFGDLLLLPSESLCEAKKSVVHPWLNYNCVNYVVTLADKGLHVKKTHDLSSFVAELEKSDFFVDKLVLVRNWPQVVFEVDCSTSQVADKKQNEKWLTTKSFQTGTKAWNDGMFEEFNQWWKNGDTFFSIEPVTRDLESTISINTLTVSRKEKKVAESVEKIVVWHKYGYGERQAYLTDCPNLRPIIKTFSESVWGNKRFLVGNRGTFLHLQNLVLFSSEFPVQKWAEDIDTKILDYLVNSKAFVDYLKQSYIIPKFANYDSFPLSDRYCEMSFASKQEAKLYMIKLLSGFTNNTTSDKNEHPEMSTLFIKSEHFKDFNNKYDPAKDCISLVIVNCFDKRPAHSDIIKAYDNFVVIFLTPQSSGGKGVQDKTWLIDSDILQICEQEVQLPNLERVPLKDFIGPGDNEAFALELNNFPKILLQLLEILPEELVQIGKAPPTVFESESNYFHVGKVFTEAEIIKYYKKSDEHCEQIPNHVVVLITENNFNKESFPEFFTSLGNSGVQIIPLVRSNNDLPKYFKICSENSSSFVDLVYLYFSAISTTFQLKYQYNPGFYTGRDIYAPTLDFGGWVNGLRPCEKTVKLNGEVITQDYRVTRDTSSNIPVVGEERFLNFRDTTVDLNDVSQIRFDTGKDQLAHVEFLDNKKKVQETFSFEIVKVKEKDLFSKNIVILSDEPGMGKSTSLTKLAEKLQSSQVGDGRVPWIVFIELKSLNNFSSSQSQNSRQELDNFINFVYTDGKDDQDLNTFEKLLLKTCLFQSSPKIRLVFILDGFDEMVDPAQTEFLYALNCLSVHTSSNIYISTRRHMEDKLELSLGVFAHRFVPIQRAQMVEYLSDSWFGVIKKEPAKMEGFAKDVIAESENLKAGLSQVLGVPLLLKMLSEVYLEQVWNNEANPNFQASEKSLVSLYEEYTERKYKIYFQSKNSLSEHKSFSLYKESFDKMVLKVVVGKLEMRQGNVLTTFIHGADFLAWDDKEYLLEFLSLGIVYKHSSETKPVFPHQTFYEYFLAKFIFRCMELIYFNRVGELEDFERPLYHASSIALENIFNEKVITKDGFIIRTFLNDLISRDNGMIVKLKEIKGINVEFALSLPKMNFAPLREVTKLLSDDGQIQLLGFILTCLYNFKDVHLHRILKNSFFTATHFFLSDYTMLKPVFVIANILQKKHGVPIPEIGFIKILKKLENRQEVIENLERLAINDDRSVKFCKGKLKLLAKHELEKDDQSAVQFCKIYYQNSSDQRLLCLESDCSPELQRRETPTLLWHARLAHPYCSISKIEKLFENSNLACPLVLWTLLLRPTKSSFNFLRFLQYLVNNWGEEPINDDTLIFPYKERIVSRKIKQNNNNGNHIYQVPPMLSKYPEGIRDLLYLKCGSMLWVGPLRDYREILSAYVPQSFTNLDGD